MDSITSLGSSSACSPRLRFGLEADGAAVGVGAPVVVPVAADADADAAGAVGREVRPGMARRPRLLVELPPAAPRVDTREGGAHVAGPGASAAPGSRVRVAVLALEELVVAAAAREDGRLVEFDPAEFDPALMMIGVSSLQTVLKAMSGGQGG